jgi:hypothetical protein
MALQMALVENTPEAVNALLLPESYTPALSQNIQDNKW